MTDKDPTKHPRTALDHIILFIGSLGYIGFVPVASGTVTVAVIGVPMFLLLRVWLEVSWAGYAVFVVVFVLCASWIAGRTDQILGEKDSHKNVIDEVPGFLIALFGFTEITWQILTAAFILERSIDIIKVWPATWVERRVRGGWGVVLDDVVAGLYALGLLHLLVYLAPSIRTFLH